MAVVGCTGTSPADVSTSLYSGGVGDPAGGNPVLVAQSQVIGLPEKHYSEATSSGHPIHVGLLISNPGDENARILAMSALLLHAECPPHVQHLGVLDRLFHVGKTRYL